MRQKTLVLAGMLAFLGGCATMVHGPYQDVTIDSSPPGATATVTPMLSERGPLYLDSHKQYSVTTPATLRLRRDNTYRVEIAKPGYKLGTKKVESAYDWLWAPVTCGPCEAIGDLPTYDLKGQPWAVRVLEAAFYEYPKGLVRAWGRGTRIFSPDALLGTSFKLRPEGEGFLSGWHGLGTARVSTTLDPTAP